jgi:hypothetical protein
VEESAKRNDDFNKNVIEECDFSRKEQLEEMEATAF